MTSTIGAAVVVVETLLVVVFSDGDGDAPDGDGLSAGSALLKRQGRHDRLLFRRTSNVSRSVQDPGA